jgi:hypothetical protein
MTNPKTPAEATAAKIIQQMYDDVAIDHHLHPDDDFEKILDIVADQLDNDYGNSDADTREAVEVDELSKNTLGSYVKKAADSTRVNTRWAARTGDRDAEDIVDKRRKGINKAVDKLTNEDVEGTAGNAMEAALAELRKLAGLR